MTSILMTLKIRFEFHTIQSLGIFTVSITRPLCQACFEFRPTGEIIANDRFQDEGLIAADASAGGPALTRLQSAPKFGQIPKP
jgi:hypothetical protein